MQAYPRAMVPCVYMGFLTCLLSLVLASFAQKVSHIVFTQGLLFGIGWAVCYTPVLLMLNQWFISRRGSAYGILFGSSGLFAMIWPFVLETGLNRYGFRVTLRATALFMLIISGPGMLLIKPRVKSNVSRRDRDQLQQYRSLFREPIFLLFCAGVFLQGASWFLPRFFLPSFAADLGLSHKHGAALLATFGIAQITGQFAMGWLSDRTSIYIPILLSTVVTSVSTLLIWAPAKIFMPNHVMLLLMVYSSLYGSFGGGYTVLWARIAKFVTEDEYTIMTIYSSFSVMRGLGNVLSGPVSALLLCDKVSPEAYGAGLYKGIAIFVGGGMALSACTALGALWKGRPNNKDVPDADKTEMEPFVASPTDL